MSAMFSACIRRSFGCRSGIAANPTLCTICHWLRGTTRGLAARARGLRPLCVVASVALGLPAAAGAQIITEFPIPTANSGPFGITAGPDAALWFAEGSGNKIGRITTAGAVSEFSIPTANSGPSGVAVGSDGALWFTELSADKIGRITTSGVITEYPVPTGAAQPNWIIAGPDGALWFTEQGTNQIGRITTAGVITEYPVSPLPPFSGVVLMELPPDQTARCGSRRQRPTTTISAFHFRSAFCLSSGGSAPLEPSPNTQWPAMASPSPTRLHPVPMVRCGSLTGPDRLAGSPPLETSRAIAALTSITVVGALPPEPMARLVHRGRLHCAAGYRSGVRRGSPGDWPNYHQRSPC